MVAAQNGTLVVKSLKTGLVRNVDVYASDVTAAPCTFGTGGAAVAGSPNFCTFPEDVIVVDFSIVTGLTVSVAGNLRLDDAPTPSTIRFANYLNTLPFRPAINLLVRAGQRFGIQQI